MYRVALCEDEEVFSKAQERICSEILEKLNIEYQIAVFDSSAAFWAAFSSETQYDFLLLDIVLDETSGVDLARRIREHDSDAAIVFITANPEYALLGYDVNALHYLIKPLDIGILEKLIASDYERRFRSSFLLIKAGTQSLRIPMQDIVSLETAGRRVLITLSNGTAYHSGKLSELMAILPKEHFVRCHIGYAVNLRNIQKLMRTEVITVTGKTIPVSRTYFASVQKAFLKQMWEV
jgi:DNA-binding LytR/AlgR family response regulator